MLNLKEKLNGSVLLFKEGSRARFARAHLGRLLQLKRMAVPNALLRCAWLKPRLTPGEESFVLLEVSFPGVVALRGGERD